MNNVFLWWSRAWIVLLVVSALVNGHKEPADLPTTSNGLEVEVKTDKALYTSGEAIRFTVLLVNKGSSPVYIARSFLASGGGIAGFDVFVKQTQGTKSSECPLYADRFGEVQSRPAEQILKEDFLSLAPGGIVGYTAKYQGCAIKHEGTYELTARYCPCDLNTALAQSAAQAEGAQIIARSLRSKPWVFRLQEKKQK